MSPRSTSEVEAQETEERIGEGNRLVGIFIRPQRTLGDIARHPTVLLPWIVALAASLSIGFLATKFVFTEESVVEVARESLSRGLARQGLDASPSEAEVLDRAAAIRSLQRLWPAATTAELFVIVFGISALSFGALRLLGGRPRFRGILAVTSWSWMVWTVVYALVAWVGIGLRAPESIDPTDPYTLSTVQLAGFLPSDVPNAVRSVVVNLSLQNLWFLCLLALGYARAAPRLSPRRVAVVVFGVAIIGFAVRGALGM